jgi:hypothetical protein
MYTYIDIVNVDNDTYIHTDIFYFFCFIYIDNYHDINLDTYIYTIYICTSVILMTNIISNELNHEKDIDI